MASSTARTAGPTPSAQELVAALSTPDLVRPAPDAPILQLPRPRMLSRALIVGAMGLLAGTTVLAVVLAGSLAELRRALVLAEAAALPVIQVTLPSAERLCDDAAFAAWLGSHPDDWVRLHVARAQALASVGRREEAAAAYAAAASRGRLEPLPRIAWADLLCDLGRPQEAQAVLDRVDLSPLPAEQQARALAVVGRAHLLGRQPHGAAAR